MSRGSARVGILASLVFLVLDLVSLVHQVRTWGVGCDCHDADRLEGKKVDCQKAGLRCHQVGRKREVFLDNCRCRIGQLDAETDFCHGIPSDNHLGRERSCHGLGHTCYR